MRENKIDTVPYIGILFDNRSYCIDYIIFALVRCICVKTPVISHLLFKIGSICFQHLYFHDWSKLVLMALLSRCSRHILSNMFGTMNRNTYIGTQVSRYRIVRSLAIPSPNGQPNRRTHTGRKNTHTDQAGQTHKLIRTKTHTEGNVWGLKQDCHSKSHRAESPLCV
jgi:hypothetical protein